MEDAKLCSSCRNVKFLHEFNKCKRQKLGLKGVCRECQKQYRHGWYLKNAKNEKEKARILGKNPEIRNKFKERYKTDDQLRSKLCERNNKRRRTEAAKEKARIQRKKWLSIPHNRIACRLRGRMRSALIKNTKSESTETLLGCSFEEVKLYLEKMFRPGMSWDNYGDWHIDHIIPCAAFDLTSIKDQQKCFHYTNLQPLWEKENIIKGSKLFYFDH